MPGKSHGQKSLVGYSPWGLKKSDMSELVDFYSGLWKQTLGGHKQNPVHTRTQEKGAAVTTQETDPDSPGSVQESPVEAWVSGGLLRGGGH